MPEIYRQCPECGHTPPQALAADNQCPACGIYFFKWHQAQALEVPNSDQPSPKPGWRDMAAMLLEPLERLDPVFFYGRSLALVLLTIWSWRLIGYDYSIGEIGGSFMHNILLPIHEAGHIFLIPFGEFMTILGGSLLQVALPLGIAVAFVVINRDNFGAAICLWWGSVSVIDLSPYIYDSLHPQMIMLGGRTGEDGPHDWIYLLGTFGQLTNAQRWGSFAHALGAIGVLAGLVWGGFVLWRQRQHLYAS
ncbi:MAG TPA: hypothetical protein VFF41_05480 [Gallionella sp.]|nr:hypothetical protein [Gallionella sp.]